MSEGKVFISASFVYFIGNIFDKAIAFITIPIFTRLLTPTDYGITSTYISWVSILTVVITLSLGSSIRTAVIDFKGKEEQYLSSIFFLGTLSAVIVSGIVCLLSLCVETNLPFIVIPICCIHAYSSSIISSVQLKYMMEVKYLKRTLLMSVPNLLIVLLSIILIINRDSNVYLGRIYAYSLITAFFALYYVSYYWRKGKKLVELSYWKYALAFSLPLIFHSLSNVILSQADRSMITWLWSAEETGKYGLAYQFGLVPLVFTTTLENVWIPWFTKKMQDGHYNTINKMLKPYIFSIAFLCIGIMLVAPEVLKFLSTPDYYGAIIMIPPIVLATFFMFLASISIDLEYYLKKTKTIAYNTIIAATINIILNLILVPQFGGVAAAYTTVISYFISFLMHLIYTKRLFVSLLPIKYYLWPIALTTVITILCTLYVEKVTIRWVGASIMLFVFCVMVFKEKKNIGNTVS